jgi:hypothetical protein
MDWQLNAHCLGSLLRNRPRIAIACQCGEALGVLEQGRGRFAANRPYEIID